MIEKQFIGIDGNLWIFMRIFQSNFKTRLKNMFFKLTIIS